MEDYDAQLNYNFVRHCQWISLNIIVLVIENKRKNGLVHSHKYFTGKLGNICESNVISLSINIIPSLVKIFKKLTFDFQID